MADPDRPGRRGRPASRKDPEDQRDGQPGRQGRRNPKDQKGRGDGQQARRDQEERGGEPADQGVEPEQRNPRGQRRRKERGGEPQGQGDRPRERNPGGRPLVVAAPDKMRGTATAPEVAQAVARVARAKGWACTEQPMADGGEGTLDVFGGPNRTSEVTGPLGDPVEAAWRLDGRTAVIETAQASGLQVIGGPDGNDPVAASTFGAGELIATALEQGARRILVGLGGTATTDGGLGALRALHPHYRLRAIELLVLCDVRTRFVDAAPVFAPQKGASPAQVELLRRRLDRLADVYAQDHGADVRGLEGAGAAGGLAGGLAAVGGTLVEGFETLAEEVGLLETIEDADLVVTAEGFLDEESFDGKVVGGVAEMAATYGVPCVAIVGEVLPDIAEAGEAGDVTNGADAPDGRAWPEEATGAGGAGEAAGAASGAGGAATTGRRPDVPEGLEIVSLVERFGRERAETETVACIEQVVSELLDRCRSRPNPA